jgi:tRNA G10  N-methylase Trm11
MPSYAAFLGHQPHISIAELSASVPDFKLRKILGSQVLLFESDQALDAAYLDTLGGIIAIAKEVGGKSLEDVPDVLVHQVKDIKGKVTFSVRGFGLSSAVVRDLYRACKAKLKGKGRPSRYVGTERMPAPSILLRDQGLLDGSHGCEIVVVKDGDQLWTGRTVAAQDVNAYAKRDMQKPVRDVSVGLLPPKLAQILLNFGAWLAHGTSSGNLQKKLTILDPFCGTGVIPMECLLRRWNVLASDASVKGVNGCERNLDWLRKEHDIPKKEVSSKVWKQDARKKFDIKEKPDVVVTETSLGPPLHKPAALKVAQRLKTQAEKLEEEFLRNLAASFPGVHVAMIWPVWYTSNGIVRLEKVWDRLQEIGFRVAIPAAVDIEITGRPTLLYRRPGQFVGREIVLLQSTKKKA